jgi:DNA methylase
MNDDQALRDFVAKYARPYDPETDDYDRPPFAADIKEGKNDPIYNAHSYHTKVPPRGIIPYILHYTRPGDLIFDPFCGSGMPGVAAQMCANPPADLLEQSPELKERVGPRHVILNDLSPAACHIAYNYNTPVDVDGNWQPISSCGGSSLTLHSRIPLTSSPGCRSSLQRPACSTLSPWCLAWRPCCLTTLRFGRP